MNKATLSITVEIKQIKGIAWTSGNIYDGQFCNKIAVSYNYVFRSPGYVSANGSNFKSETQGCEYVTNIQSFNILFFPML